MNRFEFSALCVIAALAGSLHTATGQMINSNVQSAPRVVTSRGAPAVAPRPVASAPVMQHIVARPTGFSPQRFSSNVPRTISQLGTNLQRNYSPVVRSLNPTFASLRAQGGAPGQQAITLEPATRERELRTLAAMRERHGFGTRQPIRIDPATRQSELRTLAAMRERRGLGTHNETLAAISARPHVTTQEPAAEPRPETRESPKDTSGKKWHNKNDHISYNDAFRRHWHEWHDRNWWHDHCDTIVFVTTGYYFLDGSYWYPAWGYDPLQSYYDYDGPVYTYSNLLPDEVIANVQTALQDAGYYFGEITGSLGIDTRAALANFQRDYGLPITGAIDEATVEALGLY